MNGEKRKKSTENLLQQIVGEDFPNLLKEPDPQSKKQTKCLITPISTGLLQGTSY